MNKMKKFISILLLFVVGLVQAQTTDSIRTLGLTQFEYTYYSLDFQASQYIKLGDLTALKSADEFTIAMWVKADFSSISSVQWLWAKRGGSGNQLAAQLRSSGEMWFSVFSSANRGEYNHPADNTWVHMCWVYDGTQSTNATKLKYYEDGVEQTATHNGTIETNTTGNSWDFTIGSIHLGNDSFDGLITVPVVFDVALSGTEATELYNSGDLLNPMLHSRKNDIVTSILFHDSKGLPNVRQQKQEFDAVNTNISSSDFSTDVP